MPNAQFDQEETAIVYLSTEHATSRQADGASFKINMDNSVFAENVSGVSVIQGVIPNIFPNINIYRNYFATGTVLTQVGNEIAIGQYTGSTLGGAMNALLVSIGENIVVSYTGVDFGISNLEATDRVMDMNAEMWEQLGWDWRLLEVAPSTEPGTGATLYRLELPSLQIVLAPYPSALFGEKLVHVSCDQLARGNFVHGADGKLHDILVTLPLAETEFFRVLTWAPPEDSTQRINFKHIKSITSTLEFTLYDSRMRRLPMVINHHLQLTLKIYHKEHGH